MKDESFDLPFFSLFLATLLTVLVYFFTYFVTQYQEIKENQPTEQHFYDATPQFALFKNLA